MVSLALSHFWMNASSAGVSPLAAASFSYRARSFSCRRIRSCLEAMTFSLARIVAQLVLGFDQLFEGRLEIVFVIGGQRDTLVADHHSLGVDDHGAIVGELAEFAEVAVAKGKIANG